MLLVIGLNFFFYKDKSAENLVFAGPPTVAQSAALSALADAARRLLCENPEALRDVDWHVELQRKKLSYTGEEVCTTQGFTLEQILPGLPPVGLAASPREDTV